MKNYGTKARGVLNTTPYEIQKQKQIKTPIRTQMLAFEYEEEEEDDDDEISQRSKSKPSQTGFDADDERSSIGVVSGVGEKKTAKSQRFKG